MMNPKDQMHPEDRRNMIIFIVLAFLVYVAYDHFILKPKVELMKVAQEQAAVAAKANPPKALEPIRPREVIIAEGRRIDIDNPMVFGTLNLTGGRVDDLSLDNYYMTLERKEHVKVLSPAGSEHPRYAEFGWVPVSEGLKVPGNDTVWSAREDRKDLALGPDSPVTLYWDNGQGLVFEKTFKVDEQFMFTIEQRVVNKSGKEITLHPYGLVSQRGVFEHHENSGIVHEGPIGYINQELFEPNYTDSAADLPPEQKGQTGWIGITDKYWLAALLPSQQDEKTFRFTYRGAPNDPKQERTLYQVDMMGEALTIAPDQSAAYTTHFFAGAKLVKMLEEYEDSLGILHFDLAVDFGLFYFLTKPFFYLLDFLYGLAGNFGIAILLFTVVLRIAVFPLANMSFKSFAGMKKIAPQMNELREKCGDDKQKLQEELVKLYQREKVNPMAGCLPILIQIPIFFALYKVLSMTIEMRHAPFFGWIDDLSARDPTSVFNLFGLIPWTPPEFLIIGVWPCLMLVTMILQKSMNPPPQDPFQNTMFRLLPWVMTYILSKFASGLVIYWTINNVLSMIQQYVIMKQMGVEVRFFAKHETEKKLEKEIMEGPAVHPEIALIEQQVEEAMFGKEEAKEISPPKPKKKKKK